MHHIFLSILLSLSSSQSDTRTQENISEYIILSPPIDKILQIEQIQTQHINDQHISRTTIYDIIFSRTNNPNIIGYDIAVKLRTVDITGEQKLSNILANTNGKIGTVRHFTYDQVNNKLILNNSDTLWADFLMNINQIQKNAGQRSDDEKLSDQKFLNAIKNIPIKNRNMILSEDIKIILSFIGSDLNILDHKTEGDDIIINRQHDRQDGKIIETSRYHVSKNSGLVHIFDRKISPTDNEGRTIHTQFKLHIPTQ